MEEKFQVAAVFAATLFFGIFIIPQQDLSLQNPQILAAAFMQILMRQSGMTTVR